MKRYLIILLAFFALPIHSKAQQTDTLKKPSPSVSTSTDSLINSMSQIEDKNQAVMAVFKATRLIISQTTETVKKKNLNFVIIHRFGDVGSKNTGAQTLFGLDAVNDVYIGFEYGLSNNLNINFGRSTVGQLLEFGMKYALLHQTTDNSVPLAITLFGDYGIRPYGSFSAYGDRVSYLAQAIIARKISSAISLEVLPTFVRDNTPYPLLPGNEQGFFAITAAARLKITRHMGVILDYGHDFSAFRQDKAKGFSDPLGFGVEFATGGHVFTINFSNTRSVSAINYLSNGQGTSYGRGQYRLGFTISRIFDFNHKSSYK